MNNKKFIIASYYFKYVVLMLIIKLGVGLPFLNGYPLVFIPIAYLVVKFLFYHNLERKNLYRKDYLLYVVIGYSIVNLLLQMPIIYDISVIAFLLLIKDKRTNEKAIMEKNIKEYYKNQNSQKN